MVDKVRGVFFVTIWLSCASYDATNTSILVCDWELLWLAHLASQIKELSLTHCDNTTGETISKNEDFFILSSNVLYY